MWRWMVVTAVGLMASAAAFRFAGRPAWERKAIGRRAWRGVKVVAIEGLKALLWTLAIVVGVIICLLLAGVLGGCYGHSVRVSTVRPEMVRLQGGRVLLQDRLIEEEWSERSWRRPPRWPDEG